MKHLFPVLILLNILFACKEDGSNNQSAKDEEIIQQYISENGLNATATGSGLYYVINQPGTGASCNSSSDVRVKYKGYYTNGGVFDESPEAGITFNLSQVIQGWTEGIPYFKEGGSGILLIPSALGYGTTGSGPIPGNTVLIFDVNLIEVL